jgi:hypothetical protein
MRPRSVVSLRPRPTTSRGKPRQRVRRMPVTVRPTALASRTPSGLRHSRCTPRTPPTPRVRVSLPAAPVHACLPCSNYNRRRPMLSSAHTECGNPTTPGDRFLKAVFRRLDKGSDEELDWRNFKAQESNGPRLVLNTRVSSDRTLRMRLPSCGDARLIVYGDADAGAEGAPGPVEGLGAQRVGAVGDGRGVPVVDPSVGGQGGRPDHLVGK